MPRASWREPQPRRHCGPGDKVKHRDRDRDVELSAGGAPHRDAIPITISVSAPAMTDGALSAPAPPSRIKPKPGR
jgi:hypothetical protein